MNLKINQCNKKILAFFILLCLSLNLFMGFFISSSINNEDITDLPQSFVLPKKISQSLVGIL